MIGRRDDRRAVAFLGLFRCAFHHAWCRQNRSRNVLHRQISPHESVGGPQLLRGLYPSLRLSPDAISAKKADETAAHQPAIRVVIRSPPRRPEGSPWCGHPDQNHNVNEPTLPADFPLINTQPSCVPQKLISRTSTWLVVGKTPDLWAAHPISLGHCKWSARQDCETLPAARRRVVAHRSSQG